MTNSRFTTMLQCWISYGGLLLLLLCSSCSITQHIPKGETLYIGIAKTRVEGDKKSKEAQRAIAAVEHVINVPPNDALFGSAHWRSPIPLSLWTYNTFVNDSTLIGRYIYRLLAEEPKLISEIRPNTRSRQSKSILREHGYFNAQVTDSLIYSSPDSLQGRICYNITLGHPYKYDSISYMEPWLVSDTEVLSHQQLSILKPGDQFNLERLLEDRSRIVNALRDKGYYYYEPSHLIYQVDTLLHPGSITMRVRERTNAPSYSFHPWTIGHTSITLLDDKHPHDQDTLLIDDLLIRYNDVLQVRPKELLRRIKLKSGDRYSQTLERETKQSLLSLGAFSYVDIQFTRQDTVRNILDMNVIASIDKPWDSSIEGVLKTKSNNFIGPGLTLTLGRQNLFGRGERLSLDMFGSYEWQTNRPHSEGNIRLSEVNSYGFGANLKLQAPRILLPGLSNLDDGLSMQTAYTLSATRLNRAKYFQITSWGITSEFTIHHSQHHHTISPLKIHYNHLSHRSETFDQIIDANPIMGLSLMSQLVPQMSYTYVFDNLFSHMGSHHVRFEWTLSQAGNILNGLYTLAGKPYNDTKQLFKVPFAQFVKSTAELRYTYGLDRYQSIAFRFGTGAIYSFGNITVAPFSEQFYVGGANSIRAFTVRSIGPGRFIPHASQYAFMDQTGEFKLELNAEYRFRISGNLHGALFVDSGNVWLLRPDPNRPGGALQEIRSTSDFFRQLALGSGIGVRYDLDFLVIRFDIGVGVHLPYATPRDGYYNMPNWRQSFGYHFAVGYPF